MFGNKNHYVKSGSTGLRYVQLFMLVLLIVTGMLLSSCSVVTKLLPGSGDDTSSDSDSGEFIPFPEKWLKNTPNGSSGALNQAVQALFEYVETYREKFESCFAKRLREKDTFQGFVNDFLSAFPKGLSQCTVPELVGHEDKIVNSNQRRLCTTESFQLTLNNEIYYISVLVCYQDKTEPENVGVNEFRVMNASGWARYSEDMADVIQNSSGKIKMDTFNFDGRKYNYLQCLMSDEPIRMICNKPELWNETDYQIMTADEIVEVMKECRGINDLKKKIGAPNSGMYYEVKSDSDKPMYVHIVCDHYYGTIKKAYLCDAEKEYSDDPIYVAK